MYICEVCGKKAEVHHIIHKCEHGLDCEINYKYLCSEHHRGKNSPHTNNRIDIKYKLELQKTLEILLKKDFYSSCELISLLNLNKSSFKAFFKNVNIYKEGYKKEEIIYKIMGNKRYEEYMLEEYKDFVINYICI